MNRLVDGECCCVVSLSVGFTAQYDFTVVVNEEEVGGCHEREVKAIWVNLEGELRSR